VAVKSTDRNRMADDLASLGLYATSNDVRRGRSALTKGVAHVRDYCLPNTVRAIEKWERRNAESPPIPGTWGEGALPNAERRRDDLQGFLDNWWPYDLNVSGGGER
jgi:hypothetical protein